MQCLTDLPVNVLLLLVLPADADFKKARNPRFFNAVGEWVGEEGGG